MSSRSAGTPVRRHLSFSNLPYKGQCFYLDIKTAAVKNKLAERIQELGGSVEGFLTRDLSLIITDRDSEKVDTNNVNGNSVLKASLPLSRGQALLKAAQHQGTKDGPSQDFLKNASNLGIKTQKVSGFLHVTSKLLSKVKTKKKKNEEENYLEGMSPISWDKDKENACIVKVEDNDSLYRPLFKQFDVFPQLDYTQPSSPFDVGIVLIKEKEANNNQLKKKSVVGVVKGGYCESCDHWYKCTLREHLKSEKHRAFVKSVDNFKSLDTLTTSLPNLSNFLGKHGLHNEENPKQGDCNTADVDCEQSNENVASYDTNIMDIKFTNYENTAASTTDFSTMEKNSSTTVNTQSGTPEIYQRISKHSMAETDRNSRDNTITVTSHISTEDNLGAKSDRSISSDRRMNLTQVLQNVFDADDADVDMDKENCTPFRPIDMHTKCPEVGGNSDLSLPKANLTEKGVLNTKHSSSKSQSSETRASLDTLLYDGDSLPLVPEAIASGTSGTDPPFYTFSSSCSFGENGVGDALAFLQSNDSSSTHSLAMEKSEGSKSLSLNINAGSERSGSEKSLHSNKTGNLIKPNAIGTTSVDADSEGFKNNPVLSYVSKLTDCYRDSQNDGTQLYTETSEQCSIPVSEPMYSSSGLSGTLRYSASGQSSTINFSKLSDFNRKFDSDSFCTWNYASKSSMGSLPSLVSEPKSQIVKDDISVFSDRLTQETIQSFTSKSSMGSLASGPKQQFVTDDISAFSDHLKQETIHSSVKVVTPEKIYGDINVDSETTPTNKGLALAQPCLQDLCRSGSSIRNWLLPKDEDSRSVRTAVSKLDHTLMEMENSPITTDAKTESNVDENRDHEASRPPDGDNTGASNFVASWIQTQKFYENSSTDVAVGESVFNDCDIEQGRNIENGSHCSEQNKNIENGSNYSGLSRNIENGSHFSGLSRNIENGSHCSDLGSINASHFSGQHLLSQGHDPESSLMDSASEMLQPTLTDSCSYTSISDCTIYKEVNRPTIEQDTHRSAEHLGNVAAANDSVQKLISGAVVNDDALSDISAVSSCVTDRGIKIKGLMALKKGNYTDNSSLLEGKAPSVTNCGTSASFMTEGSIASARSDNDLSWQVNQINGIIGSTCNNAKSISKSGNSSETISLMKNNNVLKDVSQTAEISTVSVGNKTVKVSKSKASNTQKKPKTTQAKKKPAKNSRSSKQKAKATEKMQQQLLSTTPSHLHSPFLLQTMYSPISQPSECAPTDPASPYSPHVWQQQHRFMFVPHTQTLSSQQIGGGLQQTGYQPSVTSNPSLTPVILNSQSPGCYQSPQPVVSASPLLTMAPANNYVNVQIQEQGYQAPMVDFLSSPKPNILMDTSTHHSPFISTNNITHQSVNQGSLPSAPNAQMNRGTSSDLQYGGHYNTKNSQSYCPTNASMITNSALSDPYTFSPQLSVSCHSGTQAGPGPGYGYTPGLQYTNMVAGVTAQPTFQTTIQSAPTVSKPNKQLSTICLADIAEDDCSNLSYSDAFKYSARPRKIRVQSQNNRVPETIGPTFNTEQTIGPTVNSEQNIEPTVNSEQTIGPTVNSEQNIGSTVSSGLKLCAAKELQNLQNFANSAVLSQHTNVGNELNNSFTTQNPSFQGTLSSAFPSINNTQSALYPDQASYNLAFSSNHLNHQSNQSQNMNITNGAENGVVYNAVQTGDTKLRLCKMPVSTAQEPKSNLTHYWNVRKTGECRLVFSSNIGGKRKAEEETPGKLTYMSPLSQSQYTEVVGSEAPQTKRRRCLVF